GDRLGGLVGAPHIVPRGLGAAALAVVAALGPFAPGGPTSGDGRGSGASPTVSASPAPDATSGEEPELVSLPDGEDRGGLAPPVSPPRPTTPTPPREPPVPSSPPDPVSAAVAVVEDPPAGDALALGWRRAPGTLRHVATDAWETGRDHGTAVWEATRAEATDAWETGRDHGTAAWTGIRDTLKPQREKERHGTFSLSN
ncbi:MAG: hypothetical protein ACRDY7_04015, partial [Acidimicrobiia bacterium]